MVRNFLDCIKSRQRPYCTLEEGHRSTSLAHLATIAMLTNEKLRWDADAENSQTATKPIQCWDMSTGNLINCRI
jgi:hypothetical protein